VIDPVVFLYYLGRILDEDIEGLLVGPISGINQLCSNTGLFLDLCLFE
jgi:hypothetical protein